MTHSVHTSWLGSLAFETDVSGHKIVMDADTDFGGEDRGPRPKMLVLSALGGCTGMDVIHVLRKMRIEPSFFNVRCEATLSDDELKRYNKIHVTYEFRADDNLDRRKVETAVKLSQDKYCSVSAMLKAGSEVTHEITYL